MPISTYTTILLDLLEEQETLTGKIYDAYAARFPEFAELFQSLAQEERGHAAAIKILRDRIATGKILVNPRLLKLEALKQFGNLLKKTLQESDSPSLSIKDALDRAIGLESTLLERPFAQVFAGTDADTNRLLDRLASQDEGHLKKIEAARKQGYSDSIWDQDKTAKGRPPRK